MSLFFFLFILLIVWFVLRPILRVWTTVHRAQKQANDFFRAATGDTQTSGRRYRNTQEQKPRRKRKKIDPGIGEYVDFEEIAVYNASYTYQQQEVKFKPEQQIEDAEWEDIK